MEEEGPFEQGINRYADRTPIGNGHLSQTKDGKPASTLMGKFDNFDGGLTQVSFNPFGCCYFTNDFGIMFSFKPKSLNETEVELIWLVDENAQEGIDYKTLQRGEYTLEDIVDRTTDTTIGIYKKAPINVATKPKIFTTVPICDLVNPISK